MKAVVGSRGPLGILLLLFFAFLSMNETGYCRLQKGQLIFLFLYYFIFLQLRSNRKIFRPFIHSLLQKVPRMRRMLSKHIFFTFWLPVCFDFRVT